MTTIAFKNGCVAADTMATLGCMHLGTVRKIGINRRGDLAGVCGLAVYMGAFLRWFEGGEDGPAPEATSDDDNVDRAVIMRRATGDFEVYEPGGSYDLKADYYALGSGASEALGAMYVGADAITAVRAAIAHNTHTGGDPVFRFAEDAKG